MSDLPGLFKIRSSYKPTGRIENFVGDQGDLFYDFDTKQLKISDGETIGGMTLGGTGNFSGLYDDLINKPSIPVDVSDLTDTTNLLFSGSYDELTNKPTIPTVPTNISDFVNDAGYLTSIGNTYYNDIIDAPVIPSDVSDLTDNTNLLGGSSFSGSYNDLTDKPTIPADVSDLTDTGNLLSGSDSNYTLTIASNSVLGGIKIGTGLSIDETGVLTVTALGTVSYNDLTDTPTIPSDVSDLTDTTNLFFDRSYNSLTDTPTIPSDTSDLTNNAGFITITALDGYAIGQPVATTNSVEFVNISATGNVQIDGNLVVSGETTNIIATNLAVSDNMIYLNNPIATSITNVVGNGSIVVYTTSADHGYTEGMTVSINGVDPTDYNLSGQLITAVTTDTFTIANAAVGSYISGGTARARTNANPDLGWAAGYYDVSYGHTGMFRDATDGLFKFFQGYTPEPDSSAFIDTSHLSFSLASVQASSFIGDLIGSIYAADNTLLVDAVSGTIPYAVLSDTPTIPSDVSDLTDTTNLFFDRSYNSLTDTPTLFSGSYTDLTDKPTLVTSYNDLTDTPTIPSDVSDLTDTTSLLGGSSFSGSYNDLTDTPTLFSGSYNDLTDTPTIPSDVSDLTDNTSLLGGSSFSGSYNDLTDTPTIPSDVSDLSDTTNLFFDRSYNSLTDTPTIPSDVSDLTDNTNLLSSGGGGSSSFSNEYVLIGTTTDNNETEILINGLTRIPVPTDTMVSYIVHIAAKRTDTPGDYAMFELRGIVANESDTVSDIGSVYEIIIVRTNTSYLVDARADNINKTINMYVSGTTDHTISWKASVQTIKV